MLRGTDGIQLVEVHQQIVGQRHLLVELVREVQVVKIVLAQMLGQQAAQEGGLATALTAYERGHTLVAVQRVKLQPVGNGRAQPDSQIARLLGGDAGQTAEEVSHVVVAVPLGQVLQIVADGVVHGHRLRMEVELAERLGVTLVVQTLAQHVEHDAVAGTLRERAESLVSLALAAELHLAVEHVAAKFKMILEIQLG